MLNHNAGPEKLATSGGLEAQVISKKVTLIQKSGLLLKILSLIGDVGDNHLGLLDR